jgi:chromosome segregation ATPase
MSTDRTTEILNYLSAMSRDIGEFRQETKARFDKIEARLDKIEARLDKIEARLDKIEARLDALESDMKEVKEGLTGIKTEVHLLTRKLNAVVVEAADTRARLSFVEDRVAALEAKQQTKEQT